ncbi:MAG TPA: glycosyl hydrolase family 18 protein [Mycobacteriales bacterium]|nr:glycosyl hydrolase family 18 protein [Mycobacteriales bacterium]
MQRSRCARPMARAFAALVVVLPLLGALAPSRAAAAAPRRVTAWLPYWDQARGYQSFLANADLYSALSPFWYAMAPNGTVQGYPGSGDKTIVAGIRAKGVRVLPTITNDFDPARVRTMLATKTSQSRHVTALVNLVKANGYDGLDVDYESLYASDRTRFSAFISRLATALHAAGKKLSVAVHPKTSEPGSWSGPQAQDYKAIGAAADTVRVMAYDYSWGTSAAGPVAPLNWVDDVARFAAGQIAPSKVELGMPLYGYDWVGSMGTGVTHEEVMARRTAYSATSQWSSTAQSSWFSYVADGVTHTVWYADAASVAAALPVVDRYGLAGAAFWRLGGEDAATWAAVRARWSTP